MEAEPGEQPIQEILDHLMTLYGVVEPATPEMVEKANSATNKQFSLNETAFMPTKSIALPQAYGGVKRLMLLAIEKGEYITFVPTSGTQLIPYRLAEAVEK